MEVVKQNIDDLNAILRVKISESDYQPLVEKELRKARQVAQVKGFRPGMAPKSLIKKMYGQGILIEELNKILSDSLSEFVEKSEQAILGEPIPCDEKQEKINWETQKDFEFVYEVGYYPELDFDLDQSIEVPFYDIIQDPKEIEDEIKYYAQKYGSVKQVDQTEKGDLIRATVNLSVLNTEENDSFPESSDVSFLLDKLSTAGQELFLGSKVGDAVEVEVRGIFENETDLTNMLGIEKQDLERLPSNLVFTISGVSRFTASELNKELYEKVCGEGTEISTEEEFRSYLLGESKKYYTKLGVERLGFDGKEILMEKSTLKLPEEFVKRLILFLNRDNEKFNEELLEKDFDSIVKDLIWSYIVDSLLKKYDIKVEYEEIINQAKADVIYKLRQYGLHDFSGIDIDAFTESTLKNKEELERILRTLKFVKLAELMKEKVKLNNKEISLEDYNKLFKDEEKDEEVNDPEDNIEETTKE